MSVEALREELASSAPRPRDVLAVEAIAEVAALVDAAPEPRFVIRRIWPEDAHGVVAAVDKAGKSWAALDAAVSVASGTPWLGLHPVDAPGPVLIFYGEGSRRRVVRRLRAICAARGLRTEDLPIRLCVRVPHLTDRAHLDAVRDELEAHPPRLVVLDPLYLAARGARGSDLYEMGAHLEAIQELAQHVGAALMVLTHYNKTGDGRGAVRITGVGPGAWGRVLVTAEVRHRRAEADGTTHVVLDFHAEGDEIGETDWRIRRSVWADDPEELASALHYRLEQLRDEPATTEDGLSPAQHRVFEALRSDPGPWTVTGIGDHTAGAGQPLKRRTIQDALGRLVGEGLADGGADGAGQTGRWWAT